MQRSALRTWEAVIVVCPAASQGRHIETSYGGTFGTHAGDMMDDVALPIEMAADAVDIDRAIRPHPTLGESIGIAAEIAPGSCTDVPPVRK